ncbi:Glycopeptide antibiotics resistance protein [Bhargavaea beijingensis]|uniref:Glycopeptide antibiotics resistance protein n=1 Tax=Bhargavaea beijingensis TaxID=426756 RepID=A0A1G6XYU4_9BACL|nr:VanZ family protein [Bhargavaea beijingensis]SDD83212.1 Glycopeptide antibiotics resistance protein [Bhargavaea beijingensis]
MRLAELIGIVKENFYLAVVVVIVLGVLFFLLNRSSMHHGKGDTKKRLVLLALFIGYLIMVIGVTFLNRGPGYTSNVDLSLFSSYREAWYLYSTRHWQFIYLNILMFVPFGMLVPLLNPRFKQALWMIGAAMLFTLSIESLQLITGYGTFEADDLFNNLLGAVIGYGLTMGFLSLKEKKGVKSSLIYLTPLLVTVILFGSIFAYYHSKEYGNLSIVPANRADMKQAEVTTNVTLDGSRKTVPVYRAPSYTKERADEFAGEFFGRMKIDPAEIEDISYPDEGLYRVHGDSAYQLSFRFLDGSHSLTDFSLLDDGREPEDADEGKVKASLKKYGLEIPSEASFQRIDTGKYEWTVDQEASGNRLTDGELSVTYYNDGTVKEFDNRLVTYEKQKDVRIKSEQEAYQELLKGKFQHFSENRKIGSLQIDEVRISYALDSKGFYQPVYAFQSIVDGTEMTILVPGI